MKNYLTTINHDLQGLRKLLIEGQSTNNFTSGPIFSLFRDICITLYETNKVLKEDGVIQSDLLHMQVIEEVRHKVKSNQGLKNRKTFNKLLNGHKSVFGSDIDNLGFYLDNQILASTTLFPTFVFADTPLFNQFDKETTLSFTSSIGSILQEVLYYINKPINLDSKPLLILNEKEYIQKDIWDQRFFTNDITYNVFLTRLLLVQNELTTCIWLENHLDYHSPKLNFDKYILLRLTSTKLFETMRNLLDIKNRPELENYWINSNLNNLNYLLAEYENTLEDEMKTLRNMIHYNNNGINFYDHLQQRIKKELEYPDRLIRTIFSNYIYTIREAISNAINIQSYESMDDIEKIARRIKSLTNEF